MGHDAPGKDSRCPWGKFGAQFGNRCSKSFMNFDKKKYQLMIIS